jgi:hypothetical protein
MSAFSTFLRSFGFNQPLRHLSPVRKSEVRSGQRRKMKRLMFGALAFTCLTTLVCLAQEPANQDNANAPAQETQAQKPPTATKTVTGCLQKGHEPSDLSITGEDGRTWELSSKTVKLGDHVGHQVTVTGSVRRESKAQEKAEEKKEGEMEKAAGKEEYGDLRVTDLKMVSDTCGK